MGWSDTHQGSGSLPGRSPAALRSRAPCQPRSLSTAGSRLQLLQPLGGVGPQTALLVQPPVIPRSGTSRCRDHRQIGVFARQSIRLPQPEDLLIRRIPASCHLDDPPSPTPGQRTLTRDATISQWVRPEPSLETRRPLRAAFGRVAFDRMQRFEDDKFTPASDVTIMTESVDNEERYRT